MISSRLQPHRVRIELLTATGKDTSGGTVIGSAVVANNVPCLISQGSGEPADRFEQQQDATRYTVTGQSSHLARHDVRFVVLTGPAAGRTLKVIATSEHGPGVAFAKFYRATCEELGL